MKISKYRAKAAPTVKKTEKDIHVWKVFIKDKYSTDMFYSSYTQDEFRIGKTRYENPIKIGLEEETGLYTVLPGFHSFAEDVHYLDTYRSGDAYIYVTLDEKPLRFDCYDDIVEMIAAYPDPSVYYIGKCTIPAGSEYVYDDDDHMYISDRIVLDSVHPLKFDRDNYE